LVETMQVVCEPVVVDDPPVLRLVFLKSGQDLALEFFRAVNRGTGFHVWTTFIPHDVRWDV